MKPNLLLIVSAIALALLAGCASYPAKVGCDGKLRPINLPPPQVADVTPSRDTKMARATSGSRSRSAP